MTTKADQSPMHDPTNTADPVPPGATRQAIDRDRPPEHGGPPNTRDAGERHATGEPGGGNDVTGLVGPEDGDTFDREGQDPLENGPPYSGHAGGAVGGSPAEGRAAGGEIGSGLAPQSGTRDVDTTVGSDPGRRGG
jgi:hypothetical protein